MSLLCWVLGHQQPEWEPGINFAGHPTKTRYCIRCDRWQWEFACDCSTMKRCLGTCLVPDLNDGSGGGKTTSHSVRGSEVPLDPGTGGDIAPGEQSDGDPRG